MIVLHRADSESWKKIKTIKYESWYITYKNEVEDYLKEMDSEYKQLIFNDECFDISSSLSVLACQPFLLLRMVSIFLFVSAQMHQAKMV